MHVVLARPYHFHGLPRSLGHEHRIDDELDVAIPRRPKPPPISMPLNLTLLSGMPSALATAVTAVVWLCVPHQISAASPAGETAATN